MRDPLCPQCEGFRLHSNSYCEVCDEFIDPDEHPAVVDPLDRKGS
ncbi:hypothetical protein [Nocardia sp. NPDC004722]